MAGLLSKILGRQQSEEEAGRRGRDPLDPGPGGPTDPLAYQLVAVLLGYPDEDLFRDLPAVRQAAAATEHPGLAEAVERTASWLTGDGLAEVQGAYVQEFDLSRRHSLNLSYWTDGDTRRRGEALGRFKRAYRESGVLTHLRGELPDYLPMVLEFAAAVDMRRGRALMQEYRPSLELLRLALREAGLPHEALVELVCDSLPGVSPRTQQEVQAMASAGPPQESVGLGHDDPRLLPVIDKNAAGAAS